MLKTPTTNYQTLSPKLSQLKVAIVHDWLIGGGAELVVEQLHRIFPEAPIYTSYCTSEWRQRLDGRVVTGMLQYWPFNKLRKFIPFLRILWFTHLDLSLYDLVISSSGAEAKGIKVPKTTIHINYCHAPTHYYWSRYEEYMRHPGFGIFDPLARMGLKILVNPLRHWDLKAARRPDFIVANSTHIQKEIKKYYHRDSVVISPPVYFERFQKVENQNLPRQGFLISGRQTPYKRFDIAVRACTQINAPLKVIGSGPDNSRLQSLAGPSVTFLGGIDDENLEREFASSNALIFPGLDDFGITPVEAMAAGTPVIAYKAGGALDYVVPGKTGIFFDEQTVESLVIAIKSFDPTQFKQFDLVAKAQEFDRQSFSKNIVEFIEQVTKQTTN